MNRASHDIRPLPVAQLRASIRGEVIEPGDSAYDVVRTLFYTGFDRRPAAIVRPADASDVSRVVSAMHESGRRTRRPERRA
jgi:hypothetical protein